MRLIVFTLAWMAASVSFAQNDVFSVTIVQGGKTYELQPGDTALTLKKKGITLRFNSRAYTSDQWHAVQIAATDNVANLAHFNEGPITEDNPFFGPGTGMGTDGPYPYLFVGEEGHHYITYEPSEKRKRAKLVESQEDGNLLLEWSYRYYFAGGVVVGPTKLKADPVYVMIFRDLDLDKSIDAGEYVRLQLHFK